MASKRRNMFHKNKTQETTENDQQIQDAEDRRTQNLDIKGEVYVGLSSPREAPCSEDDTGCASHEVEAVLKEEGSWYNLYFMTKRYIYSGLSSLALSWSVRTGCDFGVIADCRDRRWFRPTDPQRETTDYAKGDDGEKLFGCTQCEYRGNRLVNLKNHIKRTHSSEKPYACDQCDYRSSQATTLKRHKLVHTGQKPFSCDKCDYRASELSNLRRHKRAHTGEKPFQCDRCDYRTNLLTSLKGHTRTHTGEKPFMCDQCDYRASHLSSLKTHTRTHTGEKIFMCDRCEYKSSHLANLKNHARTHTGEKPFRCEQCDYRSGHLSSLKSHVRTHTGEKPFMCEQCDYRTGKSSTLKRHTRTHTGEKPFTCDRCDFRTSLLTSLKSHTRTHTGEKPFQCDRCDYRTSLLTSLKGHVRTHTGEKPFTCDRCDYRSGHLGSLKSHVKTHAGRLTVWPWGLTNPQTPVHHNTIAVPVCTPHHATCVLDTLRGPPPFHTGWEVQLKAGGVARQCTPTQQNQMTNTPQYKLDFVTLHPQIFTKLKEFSDRKYFSDDEGVKETVEKWLSEEGIKGPVPRLEMHRRCDYVEK
ncbi:hypothetical protein AAG570_007052 [Ranatra chinensis]|uniref:C2H2-type domain-containing protein n=1 Tax=Ranatra chinensis TaxID=642074 RepID=A0ABD0XUP4_9HEMI